MYLRISVGRRSQEQLSITIILYNTSLKPGHDCVRVGQIPRARQDSKGTVASASQAWHGGGLRDDDAADVSDVKSRSLNIPKAMVDPVRRMVL